MKIIDSKLSEPVEVPVTREGSFTVDINNVFMDKDLLEKKLRIKTIGLDDCNYLTVTFEVL